MIKSGVIMFIALYRWKIKPELEQQFIESWSEITAFYRENAGSLGSRLHHGSDGLWYGYAQWPSAEKREAALPIRLFIRPAKKCSKPSKNLSPKYCSNRWRII
jgi:hypothetical protein